MPCVCRFKAETIHQPVHEILGAAGGRYQKLAPLLSKLGIAAYPSSVTLTAPTCTPVRAIRSSATSPRATCSSAGAYMRSMAGMLTVQHVIMLTRWQFKQLTCWHVNLLNALAWMRQAGSRCGVTKGQRSGTSRSLEARLGRGSGLNRGDPPKDQRAFSTYRLPEALPLLTDLLVRPLAPLGVTHRGLHIAAPQVIGHLDDVACALVDPRAHRG